MCSHRKSVVPQEITFVILNTIVNVCCERLLAIALILCGHWKEQATSQRPTTSDSSRAVSVGGACLDSERIQAWGPSNGLVLTFARA